MPISSRPVGPADVIALEGRLDAAAATALRELVRSLSEAGRARLVFDLAGVSFCDSSGLSALVTALKAARVHGGDVVLLRLSAPVRSLVQLTRLQHAFRIFDDEAAAVAALSL